jgi:peptidyl-tRNA hydrolase, PTH1 family
MGLFQRNATSRTGTPAAFLALGLGNPGAEYAGTRHNIGVEVIELLASRHGGRLKLGRERAFACEVRIGGELIALAFPQTYMNLSGESAQLLVKRHSIEDASRVVVIHDELDLPCSRVKLKFGGGSAGNNGIKSVQQHLGTPDFARIRVGIGKPPGTVKGADYVLKRPGKAERIDLDIAVQVAADAFERIVSVGFERAQNELNTDPVAQG